MAILLNKIQIALGIIPDIQIKYYYGVHRFEWLRKL